MLLYMGTFIESEEIVIIDTLTNYYCKYHDLKLATVYDKDTIIAQLNGYGYITISTCTKEESPRYTHFCIIASSSEHLSKKTSLSGFFNSLKFDGDAGQINEIIFIVPNQIITKKNVMVQFSKYTYRDVTAVSIYPYMNFVIPIPYHVAVPKHEIADPEEVKEMLKLERTSLEFIPIILVNDPACIWLRAKKGNVVKITRMSNTVCVAVEYRLVK